MFLKSCFVVTLFFALSNCQSNNALDEFKKEVQGRLPEGFNSSALPNQDQQNQAIEAFHQKCLKNADEATYWDVKNSTSDVMKCVEGLVNKDELQEEMNAAKPNGDLDTVFKKYCKKTPEFKNCAYAFTDKMERCLSEQERHSMLIVHNITDSLAEFICHKEGDRIALFISEGGPECFQSKQEQIERCVNSSIGSSFDTSNIDINNLPEIVFEKEQCDKLAALQVCVVKELEKCDEPTPANIAGALFTFVRQVTPCKTFQVNSAFGSVKTSLTSVILIVGAFLLL